MSPSSFIYFSSSSSVTTFSSRNFPLSMFTGVKRGSNHLDQGNLIQIMVHTLEGSGYKALVKVMKNPTEYGLRPNAVVDLNYSQTRTQNIALARTASQTALNSLFEPKQDHFNLEYYKQSDNGVDAHVNATNADLVDEIKLGNGNDLNCVKALVEVADSNDATEKVVYTLRLKATAIDFPYAGQPPFALCLYGERFWLAMTRSLFYQVYYDGDNSWNQGVIYATESDTQLAHDGISLCQRLVMFLLVPLVPNDVQRRREDHFTKKLYEIGTYHQNLYLRANYGRGSPFTHSILIASQLIGTRFNKKFVLITMTAISTMEIEVLQGEHALENCCVVTFACDRSANAIKGYHRDMESSEESASNPSENPGTKQPKKSRNSSSSTMGNGDY